MRMESRSKNSVQASAFSFGILASRMLAITGSEFGSNRVLRYKELVTNLRTSLIELMIPEM